MTEEPGREDGGGIYREQSLAKLASPERFDQLVRIVKPQAWLALSAAGLVLVGGLAWGIFGRIPAVAVGTAILVRPKQVVSFESATSGQVVAFEVGVGDDVEQGDLLARLRLPTLEKQLEQERNKLEQFRTRSTLLTAVDRELVEREQEFIEVQRGLIEERIENVLAAANRYRCKNAQYLAQQRESLETRTELAEELGAELAKLYEAYRTLNEDGNMSDVQVLDKRIQAIENERLRVGLDVKVRELDMLENSAQESYDAKMDLVKDLQTQLNDLELRSMLATHRLLEEELQATSDEESILRRIAELEDRLSNESRVVYTGEFGGRILEIAASVGQHVSFGDRLGKMEIEDPAAKLRALAYFEIRDGKKIRPGMKIRVSPSSVERERYGGVLGTVVHVSKYPVTTAAAASQIGDLDVARSLLRGVSRIEVLTALQTDDSVTGFAWTSGTGPEDVPITAGTTGEARVTIEERAPLSVVLPFLKSALGL